MLEQINRIAAGSTTDLLLIPSVDRGENQLAEGCPADAIVRVANAIIDISKMLRPRVEAARVELDGTRSHGAYGIVMLNRPSNVDSPDTPRHILGALYKIVRRYPLAFPVYSRIKKQFKIFGLWHNYRRIQQLRCRARWSISAFMERVVGAAFVVTDSDGVQEETSYLGFLCLTLRETSLGAVAVTGGAVQKPCVRSCIGP